MEKLLEKLENGRKELLEKAKEFELESNKHRLAFEIAEKISQTARDAVNNGFTGWAGILLLVIADAIRNSNLREEQLLREQSSLVKSLSFELEKNANLNMKISDYQNIVSKKLQEYIENNSKKELTKMNVYSSNF